MGLDLYFDRKGRCLDHTYHAFNEKQEEKKGPKSFAVRSRESQRRREGRFLPLLKGFGCLELLFVVDRYCSLYSSKPFVVTADPRASHNL